MCETSFYFNPRPPCGGRPPILVGDFLLGHISIHAPRVEGDVFAFILALVRLNFNPRPPCGGRLRRLGPLWAHLNFNPRPPCGGRLHPYRHQHKIPPFQSTPPVWRATTPQDGRWNIAGYFNPRPPCGGRLILRVKLGTTLAFQSTPPVWRATGISVITAIQLRHFNPRPPCGGRRYDTYAKMRRYKFQSTPPVWRATPAHTVKPHSFTISIHAPRVEGDVGFHMRTFWQGRISIHAPRVEGDLKSKAQVRETVQFQSTPPVWRATYRSVS